MFDPVQFLLFLAAASIIAISPGPGIFYVAARTLAGGRSEGLASSFGTGVGGLAHVAAGTLGISAVMLASAEAFTVLKIVGAAYLVWLGFRTLREARADLPADIAPTGAAKAFREGVLVEMFNPKTAAFFLAFLPQFVNPAQNIGVQFAILGLISIGLNTAVDVLVTFFAASARDGLIRKPELLRRIRQGSGLVIGSLGLSLLFARRSAV